MVPLIGLGQVVAHDPLTGGVYVIMRSSGQVPGLPVKIGYEGEADGLRINQHPLPGLGTWGVIAFPNGDVRNGIWIRSHYASQVNAITSQAGEPYTKYYAHQSGYWEHLDVAGNQTKVYPDGTSISISETGAIPTTYRNIVDTGEVQKQQEFTQSQRVPNPPPPKIINIITATGVNINVDANGSILVDTTKAKNGNVTLNVKGNANITVDGNVTATVQGDVSATVDGTLNATIKGNATASANTWAMTGNVTWTGDMQVNGNIQASGSIADMNDQNGTMNDIRTVYNEHDHAGVQNGTGTTDTPMPQMP